MPNHKIDLIGSTHLRSISRFLFTFFVVSAATGLAFASQGPPAELAKVLAKHKVPINSLSVYVKEVGATKPLLAVRADQARNPASVMKTVTTMAALDLLGPTFIWQTDALISGSLRNGRLIGDLTLRGGGDPFLVVESFWKMLQGLRARGLRDIQGDLVIDNSLFRVDEHDPYAFDGRGDRAYNVLPNALLVNFGATEFSIYPNAGSVYVLANPTTSNVKIVNRIKGVNAPCQGRSRSVGTRVLQRQPIATIEFNGSYPFSCGEHRLTRSLQSAPDHTYGAFKSMWESLGGKFEGGYRLEKTSDKSRKLYSHSSPTLAEIIRGVNKFSNNVMARQLLLTLGWKMVGEPGTREAGAIAVKKWTYQREINMPSLFIDNGAGLSRKARVSARGLGELLEFAHRHPFRSEFMASLPLIGLEGSVARRFTKGPLKGRVRTKTGLINGVRTMAGYVYSQTGRTYIVVSLQEHPTIHQGIGTAVQNALLRWVFLK